jgi:hypothetical protein
MLAWQPAACHDKISSPYTLEFMGSSARRFEHRKLKAHPPLIGSYCRACGAFIAASTGTAMLKLAEKAHACPRRKATRSRNSILK